MGLFDFLSPKRTDYDTSDIVKIILAVGTGGVPAEDDFLVTYAKMVEVFCKQPTGERILALLRYELTCARLLTFYLSCRNYRYLPTLKTSEKFDYLFDTMAKNYLYRIQDEFGIDMVGLFSVRSISYHSAFANASQKDAYMATGKVFYEYLAYSLHNRPLKYNVSSDPNAEKPWLKGVISLADVPVFTPEGYTYCYAVTAHMIDRANAIFSSKTCNLLE